MSYKKTAICRSRLAAAAANFACPFLQIKPRIGSEPLTRVSFMGSAATGAEVR